MPQKTIRIPLSWEMNNRNSSGSTVDARRVNVMDEPKTNGEEGVYTLKRPGLSDTFSGFAPGNGQGLTFYGGATTAVISDNFVTDFQPASGATSSAWTTGNVAGWGGRVYHQMVVLNNTMFVIGGLVSGVGPSADVWSSDDGVTWTQVTGSAPFGGRYSHSCAVLGDTIYLVGGTTLVQYQNDVWSSKDGANWTLLTSGAPWTTRISSELIASNNGLFLMGGFDSTSTYKNDIWFSVDGINWTQVNVSGTTWSGREALMGWWYHNNLYVAGGVAGGGNSFNDCWVSTNGGQTWTQQTAAAFSIGGLAFAGRCIYSDKMWVLNGRFSSITRSQRVYSSTDGVTWTQVTATGPDAALQGNQSVTFRAPASVSASRFQTIWSCGGTDVTVYKNTMYYGTMNIAIAASVALSPTVSGLPFQFNSFKEGSVLLVKNASNMWVYDGASLQKVLDANFPSTTVPGIVVIGGHAFVMDPTGLIYNCILDDPFHWPSLNVVGADYEDDPGVAIAKYKNYLVAFGTYTIQFFYDSGNNEGSPLLPYLAANAKIGCVGTIVQGSLSVASVGDTLAWIGQTREGRRQVMMLDGLQPVPISTPYIEKLLSFQGPWTVGSTAYQGHHFLILNMTPGDRSWVFDLQSKHWFEWESALGRNGTSFDFGGYAFDTDSNNYAKVLSLTTGKVLAVSESYDDLQVPFTVLLQTQKVDGGNNRKKFWGQLEVIGDRSIAALFSNNPTSMPTLSFSDDDYQTWSTPRPVDMGTPRPVLYRNGSSRRRAIRYAQTDSQPMRLEALELTWEE